MKRFLLALPIALAVSYGLVAIMALMVNLNAANKKAEEKKDGFNFVITQVEESSQKRQRILPEPPRLDLIPKPKPASVLNQQEINQLTSVESTPTLAAVTDLNMSFAVDGLAIAPPTSIPQLNAQLGQSQEVLPLHRTEPNYPSRARKRNIEGYVVLSFDIGLTGQPQNIVVEEAEPQQIFNREAIRAVKKWQYQPLMVNGEPRVRLAQRIKLDFKIE